MDKVKYLQAAFTAADIELNTDKAEKFVSYYEMLTEKNKVMNLTAITEFEDVVCKHFIDSLMIKRICLIQDGAKGIDIGTGAGFPGIPLKIMYPSTEFVLVDSVGKKLNFIEEAAGTLGLTNIKIIHARAEDLAHNSAHREKYDFCVSRAVANLSTLSEYCIPFVKPGGVFVAYKGEKSDEEIKTAERAINLLGGYLEKVDEYNLPGTDFSRTLILIRKEKPTPNKYPRKAGTPVKEPL